jgi:hypothetical protein
MTASKGKSAAVAGALSSPAFVVPEKAFANLRTARNTMECSVKIDMIEQILFGKCTWLAAFHRLMRSALSKPPAVSGA